jgi:murein L,D-transpeptidase YafK
MQPIRLRPLVAAGAAVAGLYAFAFACYLLLLVLGDRTIPDHTPPRFDRAPLLAALETAGFKLGAPAHVRIFKREKRLEVWMAREDGRYAMFRSYDICTFSGSLGPKLAEGDRQAPEGFYRVSRAQLNPNSRHHLAFNLGYPNAFDMQHGRTGSALMVHGGCSSIGCYAITDEGVDEVYAVVEAALDAGQDAVDVHVFPFALTATALEVESQSPWLGFWQNLKRGYDEFEAWSVPPKVSACNGEYRFGADAEGPDCVAIAAWS